MKNLKWAGRGKAFAPPLFSYPCSRRISFRICSDETPDDGFAGVLVRGITAFTLHILITNQHIKEDSFWIPVLNARVAAPET
jgi:hypothetical protein